MCHIYISEFQFKGVLLNTHSYDQLYTYYALL